MTRLPNETPAKCAFAEVLKPAKKKRGRPPLTWTKSIINDLSPLKNNLNLSDQHKTQETLTNLCADRKKWKQTIRHVMSGNGCDTT